MSAAKQLLSFSVASWLDRHSQFNIIANNACTLRPVLAQPNTTNARNTLRLYTKIGRRTVRREIHAERPLRKHPTLSLQTLNN